MPICYVSACEDLVDALFCFLCYCFGDNAGCDDFVKDLAALFLAEQLYGVLEQLGRKLLDNGGGIGIVKQLLDVRFLKSMAILLFVIAGASPRRCLHYTVYHAKWQEFNRRAFI